MDGLESLGWIKGYVDGMGLRRYVREGISL